MSEMPPSRQCGFCGERISGLIGTRATLATTRLLGDTALSRSPIQASGSKLKNQPYRRLKMGRFPFQLPTRLFIFQKVSLAFIGEP
jgi:hypothetical protein